MERVKMQQMQQDQNALFSKHSASLIDPSGGGGNHPTPGVAHIDLKQAISYGNPYERKEQGYPLQMKISREVVYSYSQ